MHIDETARLLLAAVARGDAEVARRLEDSLVKWWGGRQYDFGADSGAPQPGWSRLTLAFADLSWDQARSQIPDLPEGAQAEEASARLLAVVLKSYWTDVCMVTSLVMLEHLASIESAEASLCLEIVGALMGGRGYDKGGRTDFERYQDAGTAVVRLTRLQFADRAYMQRLDKIVERFRSDTQEPMTSGRMYSFSGADDVDTLTRGQAIYLTALVAGHHDELRAFTRFVEAWHGDLSPLDSISRHFNALATDIRQDDFKKHSVTIEKLRVTLERTDSVADAIARAAAACEEAAKTAAKARETTVNDALLDPARLVELAQRVNSRVFSSNEPTEFPIAVTTDFVATDELLEAARQRFTGVSKLPFTIPRLEALDNLSPYRLPEDGDVPFDMVIRPPENPKRGLHATVNGVEVYAVPMSSSRYLVLPKEWLKTLRYQQRQGTIGLAIRAENEATGRMDITFEFACEFAAASIP